VRTADGKWWQASLRIISESISAAEVTARLRLEPSSAREKGFRVADHPNAMVLKRSVWNRRSGLASDIPLDEHLVALLDLAEPRSLELASLRQEGCTVEFFTGFSSSNGQGGITLEAALLGRLSALGIDLSLDLYPPRDD
jgi:hypothetical protein